MKGGGAEKRNHSEIAQRRLRRVTERVLRRSTSNRAGAKKKGKISEGGWARQTRVNELDEECARSSAKREKDIVQIRSKMEDKKT